jgi:hypothetical protein
MTKEVVTPNGFKVTLKEKASYREYFEIEKAINAQIKITSQGSGLNMVEGGISMAALDAGAETAMKLFVLGIVDQDGNKVESVFDLPIDDGVFVRAEVDALVAASQPPSKKKQTE